MGFTAMQLVQAARAIVTDGRDAGSKPAQLTDAKTAEILLDTFRDNKAHLLRDPLTYPHDPERDKELLNLAKSQLDPSIHDLVDEAVAIPDEEIFPGVAALRKLATQ